MRRGEVTKGSAWALVTGAGSGIGRCFALRLARLGYRLVLVGNDLRKLECVRAELRALDAAEVRIISCDLARAEAAQELYDRLRAAGIAVDVLINNAGIFSFRDIIRTPAERIERVIMLHCLTATQLCRLVAREMAARNGFAAEPGPKDDDPAMRTTTEGAAPAATGTASAATNSAPGSALAAGSASATCTASAASAAAGSAPATTGTAPANTGDAPATGAASAATNSATGSAPAACAAAGSASAASAAAGSAPTTTGTAPAPRRRFHILNMASYSLWMPFPGLTLYSASKAYLKCFSVAFAKEVREAGIRVTAVCPAGVATDLYGLTPRWQRIGLRMGVLISADCCARRGLWALWHGQRCTVPDWWNRLWIPLCKLLPMCLIRPIRRFTMKFQK